MSSLDDHPIQQRWPARHPDRLQLYSSPTSNGVKASIMLEECGVPYEAHYLQIMQDETFTSEFLALNPNGKIPAIIDPDGPGGKRLELWESGAILCYLAQKSGKFLPEDPVLALQCQQWVFYQVAGLGPVVGQVGYFHRFGGKDIEDKRPLQRFVKEGIRVLDVLEERLAQGPWIMGEHYSIADIAWLGWVHFIEDVYAAGALLECARRVHTQAWLERCLARPAVQRGLVVPKRP